MKARVEHERKATISSQCSVRARPDYTHLWYADEVVHGGRFSRFGLIACPWHIATRAQSNLVDVTILLLQSHELAGAG